MKYLIFFYTCIFSFILIPKAIKLRKTILFSSDYYLKTYDDIDDIFLFPELHFLRHGMYEDRNPHPLFDTRFYIDQVPFFFGLKTDPITHYLTIGAKQGLNPHPLFNGNFYIQNCPSAHSTNPLEHYLSSNSIDSADPNPLFFTSVYKKNIKSNDLPVPPLLHYLYSKDKEIQTFTEKTMGDINKHHNFKSYIERFSTFYGVLLISGWAFAPEKSISKIGYLNSLGSISYLPWPGLPSNDLIEPLGVSAGSSRFELKLLENLPLNHLDIVLVFQFTDGTAGYEFSLERYGLQERPHTYFIGNIFYKMLREDRSSASILEIGSRDRSGFVPKNHLVPSWFEYTGTDIMAGGNVDVICDAHEIGSFFPNKKFDYVFSLNVFEHLLVPWKVALEINKLLKLGGKVMIFTHQTMPLHDTPCDYWRFSDKAWQALFNKDTGFAISYSGMGDPVSIVAQKVHVGSYSLSLAPAFLHSMVIAEKIGEPNVKWDVNIKNVDGIYPNA